MSTQCRNLKHYVDLHTSTQCFHELENLNFLKKEAFWYVVICLKMEKNIKRKDWDEIRPKKNFQWKWQWFKEFYFLNYMRTKECPHSVCKTRRGCTPYVCVVPRKVWHVPHKRNSKVWPGGTKEKTMKYPISAMCTCVCLGFRVSGTAAAILRYLVSGVWSCCIHSLILYICRIVPDLCWVDYCFDCHIFRILFSLTVLLKN